MSYLLDDGFLIRCWCCLSSSVHESVYQENHFILSFSVWHKTSAGVRKTYRRVLCYLSGLDGKLMLLNFVIPVTLVKSGKPNRGIPVLKEPIERVIITCVGPLPGTKSGNQHILAMKSTATCFPEAVLLRSLKTCAIVKALHFFFTFDLPELSRTQFCLTSLSKWCLIYAWSTTPLAAYHPDIHGALERVQQKVCSPPVSGMRVCCFCCLLYGETGHESLGFSPADLAFGQTLHGPFTPAENKSWKIHPSPVRDIVNYVTSFGERLHHVCALARGFDCAVQDVNKLVNRKVTVHLSFCTLWVLLCKDFRSICGRLKP